METELKKGRDEPVHAEPVEARYRFLHWPLRKVSTASESAAIADEAIIAGPCTSTLLKKGSEGVAQAKLRKV